jgi:Tol biopolymer transport system component/tRNA A-37 threonylcarbamoyl transferase component Bud32
VSARRVGKYEIIQEIGRGGMAVVYKARQPSLERHVALKVLPEYFRHDPEFLARFRREARAAAQLNHPNILYVYDVGEEDGVYYIAMEYLDGGSLADRLVAGSLSIDQIQGILAQVASGLDYAHARGLIHRDIKPGNILFTDDGRPKVADFGIARPTYETGLTRTGVLMGTPEYMAPEQAEGKTLDHRVDLYALGVVVYQMLTGCVPFRRTTPHAVLHAVIYESPTPPRKVRPELEPAVESVVLKALAKHPDQRFQTGKAFAQAFRRARGGVAVQVPSGADLTPERQPSARPAAGYLAIAAGIVAVILLALVGFLILPSSDQGTPTAGSGDATGTAVALLNHAQTATAAAAAGRATEDAFRATEKALLATAEMLDGRSATSTAEAVQRARLTATAEVAHRAATETAIAAATGMDIAVRQTANAMATQRMLEATQTAEARPTETPTPIPPTPAPPPRTPTPIPAVGSRIAFATERDGNSEVYVMNEDGSGLVNLSRNPASDLRPRWSPDGRRILFVSERSGNRDIFVMNADGSWQTNLTNHPAVDDRPWFSPDGRRIVFESDRTGDWEIYVMNGDGSGQANLTNNAAKDVHPSWSPVGPRIAFYSNRDGNPEVYFMNADGSGQTRLAGSAKGEFTPVWSPDGQRIVYMSNREANREIYVRNVDGSGETRLTYQEGLDFQPVWSPNGRRIAFASERDGNQDIYVMNADGSGMTRLTNDPANEGDPAWSP